MNLTQIDAFTREPFGGNPAAVCLLDSYPRDDLMQKMAREMNLSETAFLKPHKDGYELRWFTPAVEVDLCGHATLASAHFLWEQKAIAETSIARFSTRSGWLTASRRGSWIEMDFPAQPPVVTEAPQALLEALGTIPVYVGRNPSDWLVELKSERRVREIEPDLKRLLEVDGRGLIVTASAASSDFDFVSRFFAPSAGVDEDPVTGSAHCCLGPFWASRLGKSDLVGFQASERGGVVKVGPRGDRVLLSGQAVTIMRAELAIAWP